MHDYGVEGETPYIVMEVDGKSLAATANEDDDLLGLSKPAAPQPPR